MTKGKLERMSDPYQPPSSNIQRRGQPALYSLHGIVIATILGSFAAAVVILYLNYRSLNHQSLATKAAVGGTAAYLVLISIAAFLPESMMLGGAFIIIQTSLAYFAASRLQGSAIAYHRERGGAMQSNLRAAGVGLLTGLAFIFVFLVLGTLLAVATTSTG
ncbi:MAG: hypothetical protein OES38_16800 [Gammaproteobacteria bacterium]|nr:hypothetical protein [Gammaproteobacteria bacterium]